MQCWLSRWVRWSRAKWSPKQTCGWGFVEEIGLYVLQLYGTNHSGVPTLRLTHLRVFNGVSLCRIETARRRWLHWWLPMTVSDAWCHCEVPRRSCEDALDLQLGHSSGTKGNSWVGKSRSEGHFQRRAGPVSRGIGQLAVWPHWS